MTNCPTPVLTRRLAPGLAIVSLAWTVIAAGTPAGHVAKLISNPLVISDLGGETGGLPPVVCGGFVWRPSIPERQLGADGILELDLAIIPFPAGPTTVRLFDTKQDALLLLGFIDGAVDGLPYDRHGWNDVHVSIRAATQDYLVSVNGASAGPFPLAEPCRLAGGCSSLESLTISGDFLEESTAWLDALSLTLHGAAGTETLLDLRFDSCGSPPVQMGALLVTDPPRKHRS